MPPSDLEHLEAGRLTQASFIEMVFPQQTNHYGTLYAPSAVRTR
jgi:hypothetical protein